MASLHLLTDLGSLNGNFDCGYSTVWMISHFAATQILREINFGVSIISEIAIFALLLFRGTGLSLRSKFRGSKTAKDGNIQYINLYVKLPLTHLTDFSTTQILREIKFQSSTMLISRKDLDIVNLCSEMGNVRQR